MTTTSGWVCPACDRRLPGKIGTCRCGYVRSQASDGGGSDEAAAPSRRARGIVEGAVIVALLGAGGSYALSHRSSPPQPVATASAAAPQATPVAPEHAAAGEKAKSEPKADPAPDSATQSLEDVIAHAMPALVRIETPSGFGSGFFIRTDTILTNVHVIAGNTFVTVKRADGSSVQAHVEAAASSYDIAVLKIPAANPAQPVIPLGSGIRMRPGQEVVALGTPLGLQNTVTRGIVSALRQVGAVSLVQTDAAINPGNSGGPVLDRTGHAIAVATMSVKPGVGQGLSFGVAIDHARALLEGRLASSSDGTPVSGLNQALSQPSTAPPGPSGADAARDRGTRAFEQTIGQLARIADSLDERWRSFVEVCYRGPVKGAFDRPWFALYDSSAMQGTIPPGCNAAFAEIRQTADRVRDEILNADEAARRADVYPGARRDALRRNRLDYPGWN